MKPDFSTSHIKPKSFCNPHQEYPDTVINSILEKKPFDLNCFDYEVILGPLPIGDYCESVYYLPWALTYVSEKNDDLNCMLRSLSAWLAIHKEKLIEDKLDSKIKDCLKNTLKKWSSEFIINSQEEQLKKDSASHIDYFAFISNSDNLSECLLCLIEDEWLANIALDFISHLATSKNDLVASSWCLELVKSALIWPQKIKDKGNLNDLLFNISTLSYHSELIMEDLINNNTFVPYWDNTFTDLGI